MNMSARAPGYDRFKLIVAVILLLIFLCLFFWTPVIAPGVPTQTPTDTPLPATDTSVPPTETTAPASTDTLSPPTDTNVPPTSTDTPIPPTATFTLEPTPTATATASLTLEPPTSTPTPSQTPTPTATIVEIPTAQSACELVIRSRLKPGMKAITKVRLNFRQSAGIARNIIMTMDRNTQVEIIGGPTCLKYIRGAYLWWQIRLPNGQIGWSAEGSLYGTYYFLEPLK